MAQPPTDPRLQRCLARIEHLFVSWEECNGKPDHHRKDDTEALFANAYILPTKIFSLERKERYTKYKLEKSECVLKTIYAKMGQAPLDGNKWNALLQEEKTAVEEHQRLSQEHSSVLIDMALSKETSDKAMELNMEILGERHELEWFGKILEHIEPA